MFVQFWVDQLVDKYMGSGSSANWMSDTVPLSEVPSEVRAATASAADRAASLSTSASGKRLVSGLVCTLMCEVARGCVCRWECALPLTVAYQDVVSLTQPSSSTPLCAACYTENSMCNA
jgi:hypothetical protein